MGRLRKSNKHLPQRVYLRRGAYFYVDRQGNWHNLGRDLGSMYRAFATLMQVAQSFFAMNDVFDRYLIEVIRS